jgi:hypothetical protein
MDEKQNGACEHVSTILDRARKALERSDDTLLRDWSQDFPGLRQLILGGSIDGVKYAACQMQIHREGHEIKMILSQRDYELEAIFRDESVQNLLEFAEAALQTQTVPWQYNWVAVKRDRDRIAKTVRES